MSDSWSDRGVGSSCGMDTATESSASSARVREGEIGCVFDEIQNLVEPIERLHMDVQAGPQRGRTPERRDRARAPDSPPPGEGEVGCVFDEISNLVEPAERPAMEGWAGLISHGWRGVTERPARRRIPKSE